MTLEAEKEHLELSILEQVTSLRQTLNVLESKVKEGIVLYASDGFQGNAVQLDISIVRLTTLQRFLDDLNKMGNTANTESGVVE